MRLSRIEPISALDDYKWPTTTIIIIIIIIIKESNNICNNNNTAAVAFELAIEQANKTKIRLATSE